RDRIMRYRKVAVLVVLWGALLAVPAALYFGGWLPWGGPGKEQIDKDCALFRDKLQQVCAAAPALRGTAVRTVEPVNDQLVLRGVVEQPAQAALVEKEARAVLEGLPALKDRYPGGISAA